MEEEEEDLGKEEEEVTFPFFVGGLGRGGGGCLLPSSLSSSSSPSCLPKGTTPRERTKVTNSPPPYIEKQTLLDSSTKPLYVYALIFLMIFALESFVGAFLW